MALKENVYGAQENVYGALISGTRATRRSPTATAFR